eukprot:CAMPEP_0198309554 /NCGR_PEP_ID=MMETSP1450-20131203/1914_1 /TAXON_ID=753684 ORGANISM="Madagascaria erythrocladiodes, Strain CCMP3234" /NCGR_SAMPLE_ID=MMETSP1450 /ASSEMBLY_ACC=CAM_ASM_001115 /LENGTH=981 /DNA_ID=CAMNT_0044012317 /DNA_START=93 /DNA_END=3038 /DNA_ORIENTATION=-
MYTLALAAVALVAVAATSTGGAAQNNEMLDVHVIAHTHDDVGWLKTVDQYYYGANNSIQNAGVQYILDSVMTSLEENPERKFIYVEMAFFARWWREQGEAMRARAEKFVKNGQLEFINGGWCMNDEAGTHYEAVINQMTLGHRFLTETFNVRPTVGWHIDPFGHASSQAAMFAHMGFDGFFFARIDQQDYGTRNLSQALEVVWRSQRSAPVPTSDIFTHMLYDTSYGPPVHFAYEWGDPPTMDDKRLHDYNVEQRADLFAQQMRKRQRDYRTNNLLVTFGSDFWFQNANANFKNMDKLMHYINTNENRYHMKVKYSTPSIYLKAVNKQSKAYPLKSDDFFPYSDHPHAYWTGYFTSRPALKYYVRSRTALLAAAEKALVVAGNSSKTTTERAQEALAVAQHHDAVSGTAKQHVTNDYAERLSAATDDLEALLSESIAKLANTKGAAMPQYRLCRYLNESRCDQISAAASSKQVLPVVLYNSLGAERREVVKLAPLTTNLVVARAADKRALPMQIVGDVGFVEVDVPAMGFNTIFLDFSGDFSDEELKLTTITKHEAVRAKAATTLESAAMAVTFGENGQIARITNKVENITVTVSDQRFIAYNSSTGNSQLSKQPSGAYIFRPNGTLPLFPNVSLTVVSSGDVVVEAKQVWSDWVSYTVRLYKKSNFIETEARVGPIPFKDGTGKEIVARINTNIASNKIMYTDSQGLEMQRRERDHRDTWQWVKDEPIAGNYYPKNSAAYIGDGNRRLALVTDRSSGVASLADGSIEYMLHRRLQHDDYRGVGEPLNETEAIYATDNLVLASPAAAAKAQRTRALAINHPVQLLFGPRVTTVPQYTDTYTVQHTGLGSPLPTNVHLLTLTNKVVVPAGRHWPRGARGAERESRHVLLRLQHMYAKDEHPTLSAPATVDVASLLANVKVVKLTERSLSDNQDVGAVKRLKWRVEGDEAAAASTAATAPRDDTKVTLAPMQIRTFVAEIVDA